MIAFICLFFPAVISVWIFELLTKNQLSIKKCIYRFCLNSILINFLCFFIKKVFFNTATYPLYYAPDMLPATAINYLIIAVPLAILIVLSEVLFSKHIKISVEENNDETKEKE